MHDVDTAYLRTFVTLAETRSFSRTGAMIGRSQSAVSGQIKRLEETFGRVLLDRDTRNVALTADGERLLGHAKAMIGAADAMLARFSGQEISGEVRFGSPEDFASAYLPDVLGVFAAAHERVQLHVTCKLTLELVAEFAAGMQDLVIVKGDPGARMAGARPLFRETLVWVAAERSGFGEMVAACAARGRALPLVASPAPCVYRKRATAALDARHVAWTAAFTSQSFAGSVAAVRAGLGVSVMPRGMVPAGLAVLAHEDGWPDLADAEMCLLAQVRSSPAAAALVSFIEDRVARRG